MDKKLLTKQQLEDASKCSDTPCDECGLRDMPKECIDGAAKTALALLDKVESQQYEIEAYKKTGLEPCDIRALQQEKFDNERLRKDNSELVRHFSKLRQEIEKVNELNFFLLGQVAVHEAKSKELISALRLAREGLELAIKVGSNVAEYAGVKPNGELFAVSKRALIAIDKALGGNGDE